MPRDPEDLPTHRTPPSYPPKREKEHAWSRIAAVSSLEEARDRYPLGRIAAPAKAFQRFIAREYRICQEPDGSEILVIYGEATPSFGRGQIVVQTTVVSGDVESAPESRRTRLRITLGPAKILMHPLPLDAVLPPEQGWEWWIYLRQDNFPVSAVVRILGNMFRAANQPIPEGFEARVAAAANNLPAATELLCEIRDALRGREICALYSRADRYHNTEAVPYDRVFGG